MSFKLWILSFGSSFSVRKNIFLSFWNKGEKYLLKISLLIMFSFAGPSVT